MRQGVADTARVNHLNTSSTESRLMLRCFFLRNREEVSSQRSIKVPCPAGGWGSSAAGGCSPQERGCCVAVEKERCFISSQVMRFISEKRAFSEIRRFKFL